MEAKADGPILVAMMTEGNVKCLARGSRRGQR